MGRPHGSRRRARVCGIWVDLRLRLLTIRAERNRVRVKLIGSRFLDRASDPMAEFLQFLFSGLTVGAVYALIALGFTLIYIASGVINFAQGEFVMLGGMSTVFLVLAGLPLPLAALLAIVITIAAGFALHRGAIEPARDASPVALIMITIGASIFIRGAAQVVFD